MHFSRNTRTRIINIRLAKGNSRCADTQSIL